MLVPPGASLLGVWTGPPSHVLISSSYKDTVLWGRGHPGDLPVPPSPLLKTHLHIQPRSEVLGGVTVLIYKFGEEHDSAPKTWVTLVTGFLKDSKIPSRKTNP